MADSVATNRLKASVVDLTFIVWATVVPTMLRSRLLTSDGDFHRQQRKLMRPEDREEARLWNRRRRRNTVGATKYLWPLPDKGFRRRAYRVAAPTLLVWGAEDRVVPPASYLAAYERLLPAASSVVIPGAGHMVVVQQARAVADAVLAHLRDS